MHGGQMGINHQGLLDMEASSSKTVGVQWERMSLKGSLNTSKMGKSLRGLNDTVITLIPKGIQVENVTDYRPISCCNKVISKMICNSLKHVSQLSSQTIRVCLLLVEPLSKIYSHVKIWCGCTTRRMLQKVACSKLI